MTVFSSPMPTLNLREGQLYLEHVSLAAIANEFGTPAYVYSRAAIEAAYKSYAEVLSERNALICYAVKANSNLAVLDVLNRLGCGFDIVSGGELARVLAAGGRADRVVFSGVGKSVAEMRAALYAGVRCFNIESASELKRLEQTAADMKMIAPIGLRVNPDVDPKTHPYISTGLRENKFGVSFEDARKLYAYAAKSKSLRVVGIGCHIGSQLLDVSPLLEAADKVLNLVDELAREGITLEHIDLGGGLGIRYENEIAPCAADYLAPLLQRFAQRSEQICFEPGRSIIGNAGLLLTRVEYLKHNVDKNFAIIDAAMNDLARPALYDAYHGMIPVQCRELTPEVEYEVVGPVCESGDFLGRARRLALQEGDTLAILSAGAYGMTMSSNYNSRARAAEIMVDGEQVYLVREREKIQELFQTEARLPLINGR